MLNKSVSNDSGAHSIPLLNFSPTSFEERVSRILEQPEEARKAPGIREFVAGIRQIINTPAPESAPKSRINPK
jgi:hypothetical protein